MSDYSALPSKFYDNIFGNDADFTEIEKFLRKCDNNNNSIETLRKRYQNIFTRHVEGEKYDLHMYRFDKRRDQQIKWIDKDHLKYYIQYNRGRSPAYTVDLSQYKLEENEHSIAAERSDRGHIWLVIMFQYTLSTQFVLFKNGVKHSFCSTQGFIIYYNKNGKVRSIRNVRFGKNFTHYQKMEKVLTIVFH